MHSEARAKQLDDVYKQCHQENVHLMSQVYHIISMRVCVCVCVRYGRSPEVIRPPGKCYFFLWGMATVGQREGVQ